MGVDLAAQARIAAPANDAVPDSAAVSAGARYATGVLFFVNLVGYLDRSILTLVVNPVKQSLGLSDGEIGLMQGAAFVITYTVAGLFMGRLIDHYNRRNLLLICVAIWSLSAAACGFVQQGWQLFVARMGVGVGEAALIPTAVSLIADFFPPERRGKPYGIFTTGIYAGTGVSLVVVGLALAGIATLSADLATRGLALEPWRIVMFSMLIPGLISCLLLATMREPTRRGLAEGGGSFDTSGIATWWAARRLLLPHHLALAFATLGLYAINAWMPQVLIRDHAVAPREAGVLYGCVVALTGIASAFAGGIISDRASLRSGTAGRMLVALVLIAIGLIGFLILAVASSVPMLMLGSIIILSPLSASIVTGIVAMAEMVAPRCRGQVTSIYFVFAGVIGTAGGPAAVGYANDYFSLQAVPLVTSLSITGIIASTIALVSALIAWRRTIGA